MPPVMPGTYVLVIRSASARTIRIGRLGILHLKPGCYVYVGSAFGPGGLRARIQHHLHRAIPPHWHIDYLRRYTRLESLWYCCSRHCEHESASAITAMPGAATVLPGFGSSDCACKAHLYRVARWRDLVAVRGALGRDAICIDVANPPWPPLPPLS